MRREETPHEKITRIFRAVMEDRSLLMIITDVRYRRRLKRQLLEYQNALLNEASSLFPTKIRHAVEVAEALEKANIALSSDKDSIIKGLGFSSDLDSFREKAAESNFYPKTKMLGSIILANLVGIVSSALILHLIVGSLAFPPVAISILITIATYAACVASYAFFTGIGIAAAFKICNPVRLALKEGESVAQKLIVDYRRKPICKEAGESKMVVEEEDSLNVKQIIQGEGKSFEEIINGLVKLKESTPSKPQSPQKNNLTEVKQQSESLISLLGKEKSKALDVVASATPYQLKKFIAELTMDADEDQKLAEEIRGSMIQLCQRVLKYRENPAIPLHIIVGESELNLPKLFSDPRIEALLISANEKKTNLGKPTSELMHTKIDAMEILIEVLSNLTNDKASIRTSLDALNALTKDYPHISTLRNPRYDAVRQFFSPAINKPPTTSILIKDAIEILAGILNAEEMLNPKGIMRSSSN